MPKLTFSTSRPAVSRDRWQLIKSLGPGSRDPPVSASTGKLVKSARWEFPDDSRRWNVYGKITTLLENGDLMPGSSATRLIGFVG